MDDCNCSIPYYKPPVRLLVGMSSTQGLGFEGFQEFRGFRSFGFQVLDWRFTAGLRVEGLGCGV